MEVAFWELAPYFPNVTPADLTPLMMNEYIRLNAGETSLQPIGQYDHIERCPMGDLIQTIYNAI